MTEKTEEKKLEVEPQVEQETPAPTEEKAAPKEVMQIIVTGKQSTGNTTLLANIIKNCLESNYYFRTKFENVVVQLRELVDPEQSA